MNDVAVSHRDHVIPAYCLDPVITCKGNCYWKVEIDKSDYILKLDRVDPVITCKGNW